MLDPSQKKYLTHSEHAQDEQNKDELPYETSRRA